MLGTPHLSQNGVAPAGTLTLSWTLKNRGTSATTETFNNRFVLRDVADILPDRELAIAPLATPVAFDNPSTPAIEGEVALTQLLTIPRNVPPGNYLIFVVANYLERQVEADVHNNLSASVPVTVAFSLTLAFTTQPSLTTQDFLMTPAVGVAVVDGVGAPVSGAEVPQVTVSLGGRVAALGGTLTRPNVNGLATFNDLHIHNIGTTYFLNASAPGSFPTTSNVFSIEVDSPPVAVGDSYQTDEDVAIQTGIAGSGLPLGTEANDIDNLERSGHGAPGRHLTATLVSGPAHAASFSPLAADGNFSYAPVANYHGPDSFSYNVNDALAVSNTVIVSITVRPVNDLPSATPAAVGTTEDTALPIVLAGSDIESTALSFTIVTQPAHGVLTGIGANRTYTPTGNYNGPDSFTFTVTDGGDPDGCGAASPLCAPLLTSAPATVAVRVRPVNDMPTATPQSVTTAEEAPVSFTLSGTDVESAANLSFTIVTPPSHGTLSAPPNVTYTPAANYNGPDSFTFTVTDRGDPDNCGAVTTACAAALTSAPAAVSITVTEINDPPTASNDALGSVAEDSGPRTISAASLLSNDSTGPANESGQTLTITAVSAPAGGAVESQCRTDVIFTPTADYNGPASFTYTLQDNGTTAAVSDFKTATATAAFTITEVNDPPVGTADGLSSVQRNSPPRAIGIATLPRQRFRRVRRTRQARH